MTGQKPDLYFLSQEVAKLEQLEKQRASSPPAVQHAISQVISAGKAYLGFKGSAEEKMKRQVAYTNAQGRLVAVNAAARQEAESAARLADLQARADATRQANARLAAQPRPASPAPSFRAPSPALSSPVSTSPTALTPASERSYKTDLTPAQHAQLETALMAELAQDQRPAAPASPQSPEQVKREQAQAARAAQAQVAQANHARRMSQGQQAIASAAQISQQLTPSSSIYPAPIRFGSITPPPPAVGGRPGPGQSYFGRGGR